MFSIRLKIVLLFLLVTVPVALAIVYQQQVVSSAIVASHRKEYEFLRTTRDLTAVQRVAARAETYLQESRDIGDGAAMSSDIENVSDTLKSYAEKNPSWEPLSARWSELQGAFESRDITRTRERQRMVMSEVENLVVRLLIQTKRHSSPVSVELVATNAVAGWSLVLIVGLSGIIAWLLAGRHSEQLISLHRWVNALAKGESVSARTLRGSDDEVVEVVKAFKNLQRKIKHSMVNREYFENLLDSMSESVLVSDLSGNVVYANVAAQKLLDPERRGLLGHPVPELLTFQWAPSDLDGGAWFDGPLNEFEENSPLVFARRTHISNISGALEGTVYVVQDVTQSKELMRDNLEYRDQLARSEQLASFGTLGAIVAHKFNQPLSTVRLFLQQIQRELSDKDVSPLVRENLAECLSELGRIAEFTRQMVTSGRHRVRDDKSSESAQVASAVERVMDSLQHSAVRKNVSLHNLCVDNSIRLACADFELEELLYCLINNSIQAAPEDRPTQVTVTATHEGPYVQLLVCDTGRGISPEHLDKVFEWCFTTKPDGQGTGLGLAIVRSIVELHGGRISVVSEERIGSRFSIILPLAEEQQGYDRNPKRLCC